MQHQDMIHHSLDEPQIHDNSDRYYPAIAEDVEYFQQQPTAAWKQSFSQQKINPAPEKNSHQTMTANKIPMSGNVNKQLRQKETSSGSITHSVYGNYKGKSTPLETKYNWGHIRDKFRTL